MQALLYINDYLLLRSVCRKTQHAGLSVLNRFQKLPHRKHLPAPKEVDLIILHHITPRFGTAFQQYNNLYLTEIIYPETPVLIISDATNEAVYFAFRLRPRLATIQILTDMDHFAWKVTALLNIQVNRPKKRSSTSAKEKTIGIKDNYGFPQSVDCPPDIL